jgi:hypothetical protein
MFEAESRRKEACFLRVLEQWFSTFMRPRPSKLFFVRRGPSSNKFTRKYLSSFVKVRALS